MADDAPDASPKNEPLNVETKEDAETRATRRELKQSSISDPPTSGAEDAANTSDAPDKDMKEQITSPKKKRAHDQLEGSKEAEENDTNSIASSDSAKDRSLRLEPEKKRHRDEDTEAVCSPDHYPRRHKILTNHAIAFDSYFQPRSGQRYRGGHVTYEKVSTTNIC